MLRKKVKTLTQKELLSKTTTITPSILKDSYKVLSNFLQKLVNYAMISGKFPDNLKLADVTPVFKKKMPLDKMDYRPISVLPTILKIFEKLMEKQLNYFI